MLLFEVGHAATKARLLVLYPQTNPAYEAVFNEIISGIDSYPESEHFAIPIHPTSEQDDIKQFVKDNHIGAIIALGKQVYDFADTLNVNIPTIYGGLIITPNKGHSGISLVASPRLFIAHLEKIAPDVKRIHTVYSRKNSGWIIDIARKYASEQNIELHAHAATDIRDAVSKFKTILDEVESPQDSIWLLLDDILPDKTVLPIALEVAWKKRVVIFSNNPSHAKRGALFALFPDHHQMGYSLARLAMEHASKAASIEPVVLPLSNLKISFNRRTASHLGLRHLRDIEDDIDVVYPLR